MVPALDDLAFADVEGERLAALVAGVELGAVGGEGSAVVDFDLVALENSVSLEGCAGRRAGRQIYIRRAGSGE